MISLQWLPFAYCLLRILRSLYEIFNFHNSIIRGWIVSYIWGKWHLAFPQRGQISKWTQIFNSKTRVFAFYSLLYPLRYSTSFSIEGPQTTNLSFTKQLIIVYISWPVTPKFSVTWLYHPVSSLLHIKLTVTCVNVIASLINIDCFILIILCLAVLFIQCHALITILSIL